MGKSVIIVGASGHGKVIADIVLKSGDIVKGFLDDNDSIQNQSILGFLVLGKVGDYVKYLDCEFVIAIGDPYIREEISKKLLGVNWYTAIHPTATISTLGTVIYGGTVVMANAVINPDAKIGKHCIVNTAAVVEHDCVLEDFCHVSPNVTLAGATVVEKYTHIGAGASTKQCLRITSGCVIGVGSVVVNNITESGVYVGVPARKIK